MTTFQTRVFQNGGSQAIRIPADLRFDEGSTVNIWRDPLTGNLVISSTASSNGLAALAAEILADAEPLFSRREAETIVRSIKFDENLVD